MSTRQHKMQIMNDYKEFIKVHVPSNIIAALRENVGYYSKKPIIIFGNREITYSEFHRQTNRVAHALLNHGVGKGERVAILTTNIPEMLVSVIAAAKIGAIAVPINYRLTSRQIEYLFSNCNPSILVIESDFLNKIQNITKKFPDMKVFSVNNGAAGERILRFRALYEYRDESEIGLDLNIDDEFIILYTSGTTGNPKGAVLTHRTVIAWALAYKYSTNLTAEDRTLIVSPLFHQTGLCDQFLTLLYLGATCILLRRYSTERCIKAIERYEPTTSVMAPTMLIWIMDSPIFDKYDTSSIRILCYGGGPISPNTVRKVKKYFPNARCYNIFGSTETYVSIHPDEQCLIRPGSVGLPVFCNSIKLVDDNGNDLPSGEMGEIIVKGDGAINRYWNNPEATGKAFKEGWFYTEDMARRDEASYLYLGDRKKDVICRGGENIYSLEVENTLYKHPAVLEAAVFGVSNKVFGQTVKAAVVLKEGMSVTEHEIKDFCAFYVADYAIPNQVIFMEALPRNPAGKVEKKILSANYV